MVSACAVRDWPAPGTRGSLICPAGNLRRGRQRAIHTLPGLPHRGPLAGYRTVKLALVRLAHRHARGEKALRWSANGSPTREPSRSSTSGRGLPVIERRIHTSFVQYLPSAAKHYRNHSPLFLTAIEGFSFDVLTACSVPVLRGEVCRVPGGSASLLLLHADALRVGSVRRVFRLRTSRHAWQCGDASGDAAPGPLGQGNRRPRGPLCRYFSLCWGELTDTIIAWLQSYPPVDTGFLSPGRQHARTLCTHRVRARPLQAHRTGHRRLRTRQRSPENRRQRS